MNDSIMHLDGLGEVFIEQWILSNDPLEGDLWDDVCSELGLDPDILAIETLKARKKHPRLHCGHYDLDWNTYIRYGRKQCRTCAAKRSFESPLRDGEGSEESPTGDTGVSVGAE